MLADYESHCEEAACKIQSDESDPELEHLRSAVAALRQQSDYLDVRCEGVKRQNEALDREIEELVREVEAETQELLELERVRAAQPSPLAALSLEIHRQKLELKELAQRGEELGLNLDRLQVSNAEAEHRIYDLDDLVWKKAREIDELQTRLRESVPFSRLKKSLCEACLKTLAETATSHSGTSIASARTSRRQSSLGVVFPNADVFSLYSLWKKHLMGGDEEAREEPRGALHQLCSVR